MWKYFVVPKLLQKQGNTRLHFSFAKTELFSFFFVYSKFIYSEKATTFFEISTLLLTVVKSKLEISLNFVAFSEYMNFTKRKIITYPDSNFSKTVLQFLNCNQNKEQTYTQVIIFHSIKETHGSKTWHFKMAYISFAIKSSGPLLKI